MKSNISQTPAEGSARRASLFGKERGRTALVGQSLTWLCGGAMAFNLLLVVAILTLLMINGASYFWPKPLWLIELADGKKLLGEIWEEERLPAGKADVATSTAATVAIDRLRVKSANS